MRETGEPVVRRATSEAPSVRGAAQAGHLRPPPAFRHAWLALGPARAFAGWTGPFVLAPFLATRLALLVVAQVAALTIPHTLGRDPAPPWPRVPWDAPLLAYDAQWYLTIAADWYRYDPTAGGQQSVVFFPLYPALIRALNALLSAGAAGTLPASGLIVANLAAVVGLALLYRLACREFGPTVAQRAVWYLLAFPVSFCLSAAYAEPVFLVACVAAVYAARAERWPLAGLAAAAAALTRPYGVLVVAPLAFEYARQRWRTPRALWRPDVLALGLPVVALLAWMVYLRALTGDPLVFVHMQTAWDQQPTSPLETLLTAYGRTRDQQLQGRFDVGSLRFVAAALAVAATLASYRALPAVYAVFATAFCAVVLGSGSLVSIWRHVYLIFPLLVLAARAGASATFDRAYLSLALVGSGLFVVLLVTNWAWVA